MTSKLGQIAGQSHVLQSQDWSHFLPAVSRGHAQLPDATHTPDHMALPSSSSATEISLIWNSSLSFNLPWFSADLLDSQLTRTDSPKKTSFLKSTMPPNITTFQKWHQGHSCQGGGPGAIWEFCLLYLVFAYYMHLSSACISLPPPSPAPGWKLTSYHKER